VAAELDPESFAALLTRLDLRRTLFNVVGGGGEGLPTMGHFLIVRDRLLKELGALAYKNHVVITTGSEGPLRQIVNDEGFRDLPLPIAGEDAFVLLTAGALFPAACAGLEIAQVVAGAADMAERCRAHDGGMTPAHLLAVGISLAGASGPRVAVPALASLRPLAAWIERRCGGWTPADVSGAHPGAGGVALFLAVDRCHHELEIPKAYQDIESVGYLGGQGLGALAALASEAAELALWSTGTPTMTLRCPEIDAHVAGQVCYLVEAAAAVARATCDAAPAERDGGERFAYGLVGRPGYEAERAEVQRLAARREARYVA
jgi:glucose-6-phosphate isomerase